MVKEGDKHHLFQHATVAISKQEAFIKAVELARLTEPTLYELAAQCGGFTIACGQEFTFEALKTAFGIEAPPEQRLKFIIPDDPETQAKNKLIQDIIATGSEYFLESNKHKLSEWEISYIKECLAKK